MADCDTEQADTDDDDEENVCNVSEIVTVTCHTGLSNNKYDRAEWRRDRVAEQNSTFDLKTNLSTDVGCKTGHGDCNPTCECDFVECDRQDKECVTQTILKQRCKDLCVEMESGEKNRSDERGINSTTGASPISLHLDLKQSPVPTGEHFRRDDSGIGSPFSQTTGTPDGVLNKSQSSDSGFSTDDSPVSCKSLPARLRCCLDPIVESQCSVGAGDASAGSGDNPCLVQSNEYGGDLTPEDFHHRGQTRAAPARAAGDTNTLNTQIQPDQTEIPLDVEMGGVSDARDVSPVIDPEINNELELVDPTTSSTVLNGIVRNKDATEDRLQDLRLRGEKESGVYRQAEHNQCDHNTTSLVNQLTALELNAAPVIEPEQMRTCYMQRSSEIDGAEEMLNHIEQYGRNNFKEKSPLIPEIEKCFVVCLQPLQGAQAMGDVMENVRNILRHYCRTQHHSGQCNLCYCVEVLIKSHFYPDHNTLCSLIPCGKMQKYIVAKQNHRQERLASLSYATEVLSLTRPHPEVLLNDKEKFIIFKQCIGELFGDVRLQDTESLSSSEHLLPVRGRFPCVATEDQEQNKPSTIIAVLDEEADVRPQDVPSAVNPVMYGGMDQISHIARCWEELKNRYVDDNDMNMNIRYEYDNSMAAQEPMGCVLKQYKQDLCVYNGSYRRGKEWDTVVNMYLGAGAMGSCVLVRDKKSTKSYCAKMIDLRRFNLNEIKVWGKLKHANIAQLMGALRERDRIILLTEFVDGGNLLERIEYQGTRRGLRRAEYIPYMRDVLEALVYLHQDQFCLHEDIKANNIMIELSRNRCKLIDFGFAKELDPKDPYVPKHMCMYPVGGATQASPEKATSERYGFPADIWAFACTFIHVISGHMPWTKRFPGCTIFVMIIAKKSPPIEDIPATCPIDVQQFITSALTVDPLSRPDAVALSKHRIFSMTDADTEAPPTPAAVRSNPRLAAIRRQDSVLSSLPCDPPTLHYRPPTATIHDSIPDWSFLRQNSDQNDSAQTVDELECETEHFDDGLSDASAEDGESEGYAMQLVDSAWANLPQTVAEQTEHSQTNDLYAYHMSALFGGPPKPDDTTPRCGDSRITQSTDDFDPNAEQIVTGIPLLDIGSAAPDFESANQNTDERNKAENTNIESAEAEDAQIKHEADKFASHLNISDSIIDSNQNGDKTPAKQGENVDDNIVDKPRKSQTNNTLERGIDSVANSATNYNPGAMNAVANDVQLTDPDSNVSDWQHYDSAFELQLWDSGMEVIPQFGEGASTLDNNRNTINTNSADINNLPSVIVAENEQVFSRTLNEPREPTVAQNILPNIDVLRAEDEDLTHAIGPVRRSISSISQTSSTPQQLLQDFQRDLVETSLQHSANAEVVSQLSDYLLETPTNANEHRVATSQHELQVLQDRLESIDIPKKGTLVKFQILNGEVIDPVRIRKPCQYTWNDLQRQYRDQLEEAVPHFVLVDEQNNALNLHQTIPINQTVTIKVIPANE